MWEELDLTRIRFPSFAPSKLQFTGVLTMTLEAGLGSI